MIEATYLTQAGVKVCQVFSSTPPENELFAYVTSSPWLELTASDKSARTALTKTQLIKKKT